MQTFTWAPGTNSELDLIFDQTREQQYQRDHRLSKNYSKEEFENWAGIIAYTICFNDHNEPEICSTISSRDCWPNGAYRILNRMWKHSNHVKHSKFISEAMVSNVTSQIDWLNAHVDPDLVFISRQTDNWMNWVVEKFYSQYDILFNIAPDKYLTCPNECDDTCWQRVIYIGKENLMLEWKSK
jgi:hypothetical protein